MKDFIRHFYVNNREEMIRKSIINCHDVGIHSIMLLDSPGKTIRMFYSGGENQLHKNREKSFNGFYDNPISIAFHPHHCWITIKMVEGEIHNWIIKETTEQKSQYPIKKFLFDSKINGGTGGFKFVKDTFFKTLQNRRLSAYDKENNQMIMPPDYIHTIDATFRKPVAWIVFEGMEDKNYKPYCFSNDDLERKKQDERLYKPMTEDFLEHCLERLDVI